MAFTSIAALAGGATATTTLVLAAVAEVGLAMTVVGTVTGSKDLMKLGSVMGLVGGVGGMISKGLSAAGGAAAGGMDVAGSALSTGAETLASDAALSTSAGALESGLAPGIIEGAQGAAEIGASTLPDLSATLNPGGAAPAATQATPGMMQVGAPAQTPTVNDVAGAGAPNAPAGAQAPVTPADINPTDMRLAAGTQQSPLAPQGSDGFWTSFTNFANKNKTLFSSGLQLAGGALKGANDRDMWNQKVGLEQQRLNQTGYGNTVSNFSPRGIIAGARA